ncbi:hypothetical protein [Streptomyces sp. NPDC088348]|uniref:hypothetical protein n=1 Tax=Streptomyces sp. NPDC088348 TaxID=3365853 RepID=UPI0037FC8965
MAALQRAPSRAWRALSARLGRRGAYLFSAGCAWTGYGIGVAIDPRYGTVRGVTILARYCPLTVFGWLWIVCGLTACVCAFFRTPGRDRIGFGAAVLPALLWAGAYGASWITGDYPKAWTSAISWGFAAIRLMVVSGWREQDRQETPDE